MSVSNRALITLTDALRYHRSVLGTRWRRLQVGDQAQLVLADPSQSPLLPDPSHHRGQRRPSTHSRWLSPGGKGSLRPSTAGSSGRSWMKAPPP
jgi:hypothetical protein